MVQLIAGEKGKGKTKYLLDMANEAIKNADGHIVYIDKNQKHMYELNNKIRLIDASRYPLKSGDEFIGFICGIASQDHDLELIFLDSFLKLTKTEETPSDCEEYIRQLQDISKLCSVNFVISLSINKEDLSPEIQELVTIAL